MDTVSTLSNIAHGGSGYLWYILGGVALTLSVALTINYRKSQNQTIRTGSDSNGNAVIGGNLEGNLNINSNSPNPKSKK